MSPPARPTNLLKIPALRGAWRLVQASVVVFLLLPESPGLWRNPNTSSGEDLISREAAASCTNKVLRLQEFGEQAAGSLVTRFSTLEINSYLALELSTEYHPSLRSLRIEPLENSSLEALATIDFDQVEIKSNPSLAKIFARLLSGVHHLRVRGKLAGEEGMARFIVEEARFDQISLPSLMVEEIISMVGRKQNPPIDAIRPSKLPYRIRKVDILPGYILVHQ